MSYNEQKASIAKDFQLHDHDSGSIEVQIALLTARINGLNEHFKSHKKDHASRTGLMKLVGRRRSFLSYIESKDENKYKDIIARLGLRK